MTSQRDRLAVLTAVAAVIGALHPARPALVVGLVGAVLVAAGRRWVLLPMIVGLLASGLAQRSLDGLDGVRPALIAGEVTLVSDPVPSMGGLRVDVRAGGRRLEARAQGASANALTDRMAGEVVRLRGEVEPVSRDERWLIARHVSGRLRVLAVGDGQAGQPVPRLANGLRRTVVAGTASLDDRQRSLFTGLVLGDDRHQPADLADAFRGAGLTHVLAVSGQNVAFALAVAGPVLRRVRLWPRLAGTLAVIGIFGVMTRFEPSVLRASAMAALAASLAMAGRPVDRLRVLALAVTALLLIDPLLVTSVGFRLSACAATAIVVGAPPLAALLPGPSVCREALAVTLAAQLGVAPVLLTTFGPIPVASLPANLLAVPVAGLVMIWGLTAGLAAGVLGGPAAVLLHGPTQLALGWLDLVATRSSMATLGALGPAHVTLLAVSAGGAVLGRHNVGARRGALAMGTAVVLAAVVAAHAPAPLRSAPVSGVVRWHASGREVVVLGGVGGRTSMVSLPVLEALRRSGVRGIDLLVVADASVPAPVVDAVRRAHPTAAVIAHRAVTDLDGAVIPPTPAELDLRGLIVRVVDAGERLVVEAIIRGP